MQIWGTCMGRIYMEPITFPEGWEDENEGGEVGILRARRVRFRDGFGQVSILSISTS